MPDTCQWFKAPPRRSTEKEQTCPERSAGSVPVQLTMGMTAHVNLCAKHRAEFNRINAELRLNRGPQS